jgi:hypothetical protein
MSDIKVFIFLASFWEGIGKKTVKNFVYDFKEDYSKQFSIRVNNKYV